MDRTILLTILITSLIWTIISILIYVVLKRRTEKALTESIEKLENLNAQNKKELSVHIIPWKEEIDSSTLFKNKKSIKVGYKHQLFSNGMPCFEPHITVVEELNVDKLNEENINRAFTNLELVMNNIPNTGSIAVKVLGNGKDIAKSLLNFVKKK